MQSKYEPTRVVHESFICCVELYDALSVLDELKPGTRLELHNDKANFPPLETVAIYYGDVKVGYVILKNNFIKTMLYFGYGNLLETQICMVNNNAVRLDSRFRVTIKIADNRQTV